MFLLRIAGFVGLNTQIILLKQNSQVSAIDHGAIGNEPYSAGVTVNPVNLSGYFGLLPSLTGTTVPQLSTFPKHLSSAGANIGCHKIGTLGQESNESLSLKPSLAQDMKRSLSIGSKGKRLLMDNEYAMELKLTWEEAQDMLRPPPSLKPSIVEIEDHEFEEYKVCASLIRGVFFFFPLHVLSQLLISNFPTFHYLYSPCRYISIVATFFIISLTLPNCSICINAGCVCAIGAFSRACI